MMNGVGVGFGFGIDYGNWLFELGVSCCVGLQYVVEVFVWFWVVDEEYVVGFEVEFMQ